eukprot:2593107-Ditylum_brightwellii.AAC.1
MKNGYLSVPDQMWAWDLLPEEKKFVITFNARIRHRESTCDLDVPTRFEAVVMDSKNPSGK